MSRLAGFVLVVAGLGLAAQVPAVAASSLPSVTSGARPGPDLLYAPAAAAPQLENVAPWTAPPILVSGAEAYRNGEFIYQDYLFDDYGATSVPDPADPFNPVANLFSPKHGTLDYPTDPVFHDNGADLVELRTKPLTDSTAFRVTLNTLDAPSKVGFTVALGTSAVPKAWPFSAGVTSKASVFLTVHGTTAILTDATLGTPITPTPTVTVDLVRRQFDVRVEHTAWDPGLLTQNMAAGVGLWDVANNHYLVPGPTASATNPGGCATTCPALFNMAFRTQEPVPKIYTPGTANTIVEGSTLVRLDGTWWRERQQGDVLATGNVDAFTAAVDFAKLAAATNDETGVPHVGHLDRIFASHQDLGQGASFATVCLTSMAPECSGRYIGQLQPYGVYVPDKPVPAAGFGLVVTMHGLSANYNEFLGSHEAQEMGDRGTGSIVASPESRGPDGSYKSYAEADVFEMWNDVARNYKLNPDMTDITGYSMGGGGTYRLATRWPDLFARAFPIVGPPTSAASYVSLRNIPVMAWYGQTDELVGPQDSEQSFLNAYQAGIRYDHWVFIPAGHITEGNNDEYTPAANFFGNHTVDRNPFHVTYLLDPSLDPKAESPADHVYWLSGLTVRTAGSTGKIDAVSQGTGEKDPAVLAPTVSPLQTLDGGSHGSIPYEERVLAWGPAPAPSAAVDRIDLTVTNVGTITIDAPRAHVDCNVDLHVTSDGPVTVKVLGGCNRTVSFAGGTPGTSAIRPVSIPWLAVLLIAAAALAWRAAGPSPRLGGGQVGGRVK